jgi:DNA-binding Lrp family transcriptional regulator
MAKYLDTSHISSELMELLKEAKEKIILVTFSVQVNTQIQERLKTKSKIGTLSEITLIYGNTKPKKSELQWMSEIDDLRVWQKKNLHAKCYINEKKAIICSMNLYDYSQTTNVEMGFLITKEEDPEAYKKMMEDIDDLKINGDRVKPWLGEDNLKIEKQTKPEVIEANKKQLLEFLRNDMSLHFKQNSNSILPNQAIIEIISKRNLTKLHLKEILKSEKKVKEIGNEILEELECVEDFTIGKIIDTRYQNDDFSYDQIKMLKLDNNKSDWYDTKKELPKKNQIVAVKLNKNWFNDYLKLEETDIQEISETPSFDFKNSTYKETKDLSKLTGISSRDVNAALVSLKLMEKRERDWHVTRKGVKYGGIEKEGHYGKFIIWPEEIIEMLELV